MSASLQLFVLLGFQVIFIKTNPVPSVIIKYTERGKFVTVEDLHIILKSFKVT